MLATVAAGGAVGAPARYFLSQLLPGAPGGVPWGTLVANVTGSLLLGALLAVLIERYPPRRYARPFAAVGVIGAYTTFSTLVVEVDTLTRDGHPAVAAGYLGASLVLGAAAVWLGILLGRLVPDRRVGRRC